MFAKYVLALVVLSQVAVPLVVNAQDSLRDELDSEVNELYPEKKTTPAKEVIVIRKNKVQPEPTTIIVETDTEAPPRKAVQIRKQREAIEKQTEENVIRNIEDDRLSSEKGRLGKYATGEPVPAQVAAPVEASAPVLTEKAANIQEAKKPNNNQFLVGANVGIGAYSADNVSGIYAAGLDVGLKFESGLGLLATGTYSTYDIRNLAPCVFCVGNNSLVETLKQYNIMGGVTYDVLSNSTLSPYVGGLLGYTRRSYSDRVAFGQTNSATGSNAFDGGLIVGLNINASKRFIISTEVRYMFNVSYRTDEPLAYGFGNQIGTPMEELNYYFATVGIKLAL